MIRYSNHPLIRRSNTSLDSSRDFTQGCEGCFENWHYLALFAWLISHQPNSTFLSEQISHQQPANSSFLSEQTNTSRQPPPKRTAKRTGWNPSPTKHTLSPHVILSSPSFTFSLSLFRSFVLCSKDSTPDVPKLEHSHFKNDMYMSGSFVRHRGKVETNLVMTRSFGN
jgi:hypothetical protein